MKKYVYLILITLIAVSAIFMTGYVNNTPVEVEVLTVERTSADNIVTASGKLQYGSSKAVIAEQYCLIDEILVKNGDKVEKDDSLMIVYEAPESADINFSSNDVKTILAALSQSDLSEELKAEIKKYAAKRTIKATQNGIISGFSIEEDEIISKNTELLKISNQSYMTIPVNVNETSIGKIKKDQKADIKFAAVPDKIYSGKVIKISNEAKQTSSLTGKETSVEVTIKLENPDEFLRIGYSAECIIITSTDKDIIIIPYEYIHADEKGDYTFIAQKNNAIKKYIKTGKEYKNGIEVKTGLKNKDLIIKNSDNIYNNCKITITNGDGND